MKRVPNRAKRRARAQRLARIDQYRQSIRDRIIFDLTRRIDHRLMSALLLDPHIVDPPMRDATQIGIRV